MDVWTGGALPVERFASAAESYRSAAPFPHAVFTDLFDPETLRLVAAEFPDPAAMSIRFDARHEQGKATESDWSRFGPATRAVVAELQSAPVLDALTAMTGIPALISDPELWGGGQHQTSPGGHLEVHADFSRHPTYGIARQLNLLLFVNADWRPEWGGELELWDAEMTTPVVTVLPALGTTVVFTTTSTSPHGHPHPVRCPAGTTRKSLAFYYYTTTQVRANHSTLWHQRPGAAPIGPSGVRERLRESSHHLKAAALPFIPARVRDVLRRG